jgi:hypothetical protein
MKNLDKIILAVLLLVVFYFFTNNIDAFYVKKKRTAICTTTQGLDKTNKCKECPSTYKEKYTNMLQSVFSSNNQSIINYNKYEPDLCFMQCGGPPDGDNMNGLVHGNPFGACG